MFENKVLTKKDQKLDMSTMPFNRTSFHGTQLLIFFNFAYAWALHSRFSPIHTFMQMSKSCNQGSTRLCNDQDKKMGPIVEGPKN